MIDDASRSIHALQRDDRRRAAERNRLPALIRTIDVLLFELEELNLKNVERVPARLRRQCQLVVDLVPGIEAQDLRVRHRVVPLMDVLFRAQELVFRAKDPSRPAYDDGEESA